MNLMHGLWPGIIKTYSPTERTCRVEIPGITDGSDVLPVAVFNNPLGDRAHDTEIRILPGDLVWLMFEQGDPRFPIIMGYRTPRAGNPTGWRRWRHANIQLTAENTYLITVGATTITVTDGLADIQGANLHVSGNATFDQNVTILGQLMVSQNIMAALGISAGTSIVATGDISDQGGAKSMSGMRGAYNAHIHYSVVYGPVQTPTVGM